MPSGILKFKLPEESQDFVIAQNGWKYELVISEFFEHIRRSEKYSDKTTFTVDEIREKLISLMNEYDITVS